MVKKEILEKTKKKAKKGLFRTIFSRSFIFALLLILQLFAYFFICSSILTSESVKYLSLIIIAVIFGFVIINKNDNPAIIITWLFLILGFPVFGIFIYFFTIVQPQVKTLKKEYIKEFDKTKDILDKDDEISQKLKKENEDIYNLSNYLNKYSGSIIDSNSDIKYFAWGEEKFEYLKKELKKAQNFIFMEYFIIDFGEMWDEILNILIDKAQKGVEIRLMYDGTNTFSRLPVKYPKELESLGIKCKVFSPIRPVFTTYQNHRDHRKIVVIDGKVAFTGGINLADEYIGKYERFGKWKDTGVMISGNAVKNFTLMFLQIWNLKSKNKKEKKCLATAYTVEQYAMLYQKYTNISYKTQSNGYVLGYGDSPFDTERVGENVYLQMINTAKRYVHIMTPYLILSYEMIQALTFAAKKGVDVKIIMPHIPDKKYAFWVARTYYQNLIDNGVKIYEWKPGFVHAKVFVVDDIQACVGSINIDFRSLCLHLECSSYIYNNSEILNIEKDYEKTLEECIEVNNDFIKKIPKIQIYLGQILKLFAPLL